MSVDLTHIVFFLSLPPQSILKKSVTVQQTPSAVYHYSDAGGGSVYHNKVNAIFQAAKKDLLQVIQLQVAYNEKDTLLHQRSTENKWGDRVFSNSKVQKYKLY